MRIDRRAEARMARAIGTALLMAFAFALASGCLASLTRARADRAMAPLREHVAERGLGQLESWAASRGTVIHRNSYERPPTWPALWVLPDAPMTGAEPCLVSLEAWPEELPFVLLAERAGGGVEAWDAGDYTAQWFAAHGMLAAGLWVVWLVAWRVVSAFREDARERRRDG